jgi:hypothetical protein
VRRRRPIRKETVKALERTLKAIRFAPLPELVQCLYGHARLGSPLAERLLQPWVDREALCESIPFAVLLESMEWEERRNLRRIISMFKLPCPPGQTVNDAIRELHMRLRQETGNEPHASREQ